MFKKVIINEPKKLENIDTALYTADFILEKALNISENILRCGGEPHRIEDTITRICTAYGAIETDVFALPSLVIAGIKMADGTVCSQVRRIYKTSNNMSKLDALNDLSRKVCEGVVHIENVDEYIDKVPGQHVIMVYGDYVKKVKDVCNLLDIEVVE